jgi:hypothetical protein
MLVFVRRVLIAKGFQALALDLAGEFCWWEA